jgi:hypothetical protein
MKAYLYIFGTSHPIQCGSADCTQNEVELFEAELRKTCQILTVRRIAEEMTEEGLRRHGVAETTGERFAKELGIPHHYVDLNFEERKSFSLDEFSTATFALRQGFRDGGGAFHRAFTKIADDVRERCWCTRILAREEWPTLFICGADHVGAVQKLWKSMRLEGEVLHKYYSPT